MRTTSRKRGSLPPMLLPLLFGAVALFGVVILFREPLSSLLVRLYAPLLELRNALSRTQVSALEAQLQGLEALLVDRAVLYEENLYLKRLLGRDAEHELILAGVLMRPPGTPYDTLLIDAGERQGVMSGDWVSAGGSALIGRISQVYEHAARVVLFSAPGEEHQGLLSRNESVIPVVVLGQGGGSLWAQVPAGTGATAGDTILIPGLAGGITASVVAVEVGESESFETLYLRLPANPHQLRTVEVWRSAQTL